MDTDAANRRLTDDLEFFNEHANIVIKDDQGQLVSLRFNIAQKYLHAKLEEQKRKTGWVRALVIKGRQQGISTYIQDRFYHQTVRTFGKSTFILSHEGKTTDKLFDMVRRFQDNINPAMRPTEGKSNTRQMTFPKLNADYSAGTAGNEQVGRGGTAQLFHGSEAAYWEHAYAIQDGALNSIRLAPGTEIILESTANGPTGLFHEKCMLALRKPPMGDYILIFIPWFWEDDYERQDDGSELTEEEREYISAYLESVFPFQNQPISFDKARRKILWRRAKIIDLCEGNNVEAGKAKFRSIYPSNPIEAFLSTGVGLIRSDAIAAARKAQVGMDQFAPRVAGVDAAGDGKKADRTVIAIRQGRWLEKVLTFETMTPMELAGICARLIDTESLDMMFIDRGYGEGTISRLQELHYGRKVMGIAFNQRPLDPDKYVNKRSEIIIECAKWMNEGGVQIPDDDDIHADFACMPLDKETSNGIKYIPPKEEIRKLLGRSPDIYDAVALTFAYPVRRAATMESWRKADTQQNGFTRAGKGGLTTLARKRAMR